MLTNLKEQRALPPLLSTLQVDYFNMIGEMKMKDEKYWYEKYKDYSPEELRAEKIDKELEAVKTKSLLNRLGDIICRWKQIDSDIDFYKHELKILIGKKKLLKRESSLILLD